MGDIDAVKGLLKQTLVLDLDGRQLLLEGLEFIEDLRSETLLDCDIRRG